MKTLKDIISTLDVQQVEGNQMYLFKILQLIPEQ